MNWSTHCWLVSLTLAISVVPGSASAQFGSPASDLAFTPIPPCRILDTRLAGGALAANTARSFDVTAVSDYSFQGGEASNCQIGTAGSFAALAVNFTIINPNVSGTLKTFPFLGTTPSTATTMSYAAGEVRSNFTIVKLDQGASNNEMTLLSSAAVHVTADVVGYFITPQAPAIDCVETTSSNITVIAGSFASGSSPACASGYTMISGGCSMSTFDGRIVTSRTMSGTNTHFCAFRNENATSSVTGVAYGRCCRIGAP